jgi:hypothetical protein
VYLPNHIAKNRAAKLTGCTPELAIYATKQAIKLTLHLPSIVCQMMNLKLLHGEDENSQVCAKIVSANPVLRLIKFIINTFCYKTVTAAHPHGR